MACQTAHLEAYRQVLLHGPHYVAPHSTFQDMPSLSTSISKSKTSSSPSRASSPRFVRNFIPRHSTKRVGQACDHCRARKTKCSGTRPNCERCAAKGLVCHYPPARTAGTSVPETVRARAHSMGVQTLARHSTGPTYVKGVGFTHIPRMESTSESRAPSAGSRDFCGVKGVSGWNWDWDSASSTASVGFAHAKVSPTSAASTYSHSSSYDFSSPTSARRSSIASSSFDLSSLDTAITADILYPAIPACASVKPFAGDHFETGFSPGRSSPKPSGFGSTDLWGMPNQIDYSGGDGSIASAQIQALRPRSYSLPEKSTGSELSGLGTDDDATWVAVWMSGFGSSAK